MYINYLISIDLLSIMTLFFTIQMAKKNKVINKIKNKQFIYTCITVIIILLLEILDNYIQQSHSTNMIWVLKISNMLGFSLCPVVPFILSRFYEKNKKSKFKILISLPLFIYILLSISSIFTGLLFKITPTVLYQRGPLFFLTLTTSILYYIRLIYLSYINFPDREEEDIVFFLSILFVVTMCCLIQIIFDKIFMIWGGVSMALVMYYMFLREVQFRLDPLTKVNNRLTFEQQLDKPIKMNNFSIVMLDVDNLKKINDNFGHISGDTVLYECATLIKKNFSHIGKVYRIGGDEFCVICKNTSEGKIKNAIEEITYNLKEKSKNNEIQFSISAGYIFKNDNNIETIKHILYEADQKMYITKKYCK